MVGLDGVLAVLAAGMAVLVASGFAWRHFGVFAFALGVLTVAFVVRLIVRKERRAGRRS